MRNLAQYTFYSPNQTTQHHFPAGLLVLYLVFVVIFIIAYWKIFTKAGQPGWKSIIPIYNLITALNIVGMSGWYVLLFFVPFVNIIMAVVLAYKVAQAFGYGVGMTILELIFGIGLLIIGFGDAKYKDPNGSAPSDPPYPKAQAA